MKKESLLTTDKLNFVIACCAIVISLASFYATYLQASAAEKQVKAMTLPLVGFGHGNYDPEVKQSVISFNMSNSGMGAAIVHSTKLFYKGVVYDSIWELLGACCNPEYEKYAVGELMSSGNLTLEEGAFYTTPINNIVLSSQSSHTFFQLYDAPYSEKLWKRLNHERRHMDVEMCYCTLLDECFTSRGQSRPIAVKSCDG